MECGLLSVTRDVGTETGVLSKTARKFTRMHFVWLLPNRAFLSGVYSRLRPVPSGLPPSSSLGDLQGAPGLTQSISGKIGQLN